MADSLERSISLLREENALRLNSVERNTRDTSSEVKSLGETMKDFLLKDKQNALEEEENRREASRVSKELVKNSQNVAESVDSSRLGIVGGLGILVGSVRGFIEGIVDSIRDLGARIFRLFTPESIRTRFEKLPNLFDRGLERVTEFLRGIRVNAFRAIGLGVDGKPVVNTSDFVKRLYRGKLFISDMIQGVREFLGNAVTGVRTFFSNVSTAIGEFFKPLTDLFGTGAGGGESRIASFVEDTLSLFARVKDGFVGFFRNVGRIFGPIVGVIDAAFGAVRNVQERETEGLVGKISDVFVGGFSGFVAGFIGGLLDLVKFAASSVIGFFSKEADDTAGKIESALDSFSFQGLIFDGLTKIGNFFTDTVPKFFSLEGLNEVGQGLSRTASDFFTVFLPNILVDAFSGITTAFKNSISAFARLIGFESFANDLDAFDVKATLRETINGITNKINAFFTNPETGEMEIGAGFQKINLMVMNTVDSLFTFLQMKAAKAVNDTSQFIEEKIEEYNPFTFVLNKVSEFLQRIIKSIQGILPEIPDLSNFSLAEAGEKLKNLAGSFFGEEQPETFAPPTQIDRRDSPPTPVEIPKREMNTNIMNSSSREMRQKTSPASVAAIDAKTIDASTRINSSSNSFMAPNVSPIDSLDRVASPA